MRIFAYAMKHVKLERRRTGSLLTSADDIEAGRDDVFGLASAHKVVLQGEQEETKGRLSVVSGQTQRAGHAADPPLRVLQRYLS
jgi:hypothetical protein